MIRIATNELLDALHNVAMFAGATSDLTGLDVIHLEWDGRHLHIQATDRYRLAWAAPEIGPPDGDGTFPAPWTACISVKAVTAPKIGLLRVLAPNKGDGATWTAVTTLGDRVRFTREPWKDDTPTVFEAPTVDTQFPPIRRLLSRAPAVTPVDTLGVAPHMLATLGKLRQSTGEPIVLRTTGPATLVHVQLGDRFRAAIAPIKLVLDMAPTLDTALTP